MWKLSISLVDVHHFVSLLMLELTGQCKIHEDWEDWILDSDIIAPTTKPPTRKLIVEWVMKVYNNVSVEVVVNSWKHGTYSWFGCI